LTTAAPTPLAIQVEDLHKSFRIPTHRVDSLKERVTRPFSNRDYNELHALDGISFEIRQGEFFGIVGRNGSGKSTLLKLLASIYRADSGRIRMAGLLAPFIELGVGFNPDLSARENVVLNGVMIGLTPDEMRDRLDAVLEFAELTEFVDLKLKNYSSGMLVRLAFSVMMEADADILLIDEVLAVGDAAFQQKCADAFQEMKAAGKTIVLVTHEMTTVEKYCHRAMLIDGGKIQYLGDPAEVGRRYLRLNFEREIEGRGTPVSGTSDDLALRDAWLVDAAGERTPNVESGQPIRLRFELEARRELPGVGVGFSIHNADGINVAQSGTRPTRPDGSSSLRAGETLRVDLELENLLTKGRHFVHLGANVLGEREVSLYVHNAADFVVFGGKDYHGVVVLPQRASAEFGGAER
jgi:ABC-type polysaccharide/polyol phosphate transport system ATPase subunit